MMSAGARRRTRGPVVVMAAAAIGLPLFASGCGGSSNSDVPHVASTKSSTPASHTSSGSSKGNPAAYSACMRKNGVPNFPDPDSNGGIKLTFGQTPDGQKTGLDTSSPQFVAAQKACRSLEPNGGKPDANAQAKEVQSALAFAKCMRSHGVPKFPDPEVHPGGGTLQAIGGKDMNPDSPQFKTAQQACHVPGGPGSAAAPPGGGGAP